MGRPTAALVTIVCWSLAFPAEAGAVDHVFLDVPSAAFAPKSVGTGKGARPNPLAVWRMGATALGGDFDTFGGKEFVSVQLIRSFMGRRATEAHTFTGSPAATLRFDGKRGRWRTGRQLGTTLDVNMSVTAVGAPRPAAATSGCRGTGVVRVPVVLRGRLTLRTGTQAFATIVRKTLRGTVTFNRAGALDCTFVPSTTCDGNRRFSASSADGGVGSIGGGTALSFFFRRVTASLPSRPTWVHVMAVESNPYSGQLPTIAVQVPAGFPIVGSGVFTAIETSETTTGPCRYLTARGTFTGTFRARFTGWGVRTHTLSAVASTFSEPR